MFCCCYYLLSEFIFCPINLQNATLESSRPHKVEAQACYNMCQSKSTKSFGTIVCADIVPPKVSL